MTLSQDDTCKFNVKSVLQPTEWSNAKTGHVDIESSCKFKQVECLSGMLCMKPVFCSALSGSHFEAVFISRTNKFEALYHLSVF